MCGTPFHSSIMLLCSELCTSSAGAGAAANNESVRLSASWEIRWDEAQCLLCTLKQVVHCTNVLESEHKVHLRKRLRQLRYGSMYGMGWFFFFYNVGCVLIVSGLVQK